jgi:hypothetical protein
MSGGKGSSTQTIRYAPYLEHAHGEFLNNFGADSPSTSFTAIFNSAIGQSPYATYPAIDVDKGFFGIRTDDPTLTYEIENFPSLWDMFGKFMAGLDVHELWGDIYEDVVHGPEIQAAIAAHAVDIQDSIDTSVMPKFLAGMRDINAVQSTAFIIGKALIQDSHVREVNKFSADIRIKAIDNSVQMWIRHLDWSQSVIKVYGDMFKLYYGSKKEIEDSNLDRSAKDTLWDMGLFENAKSFIGAMHGAAAGGETKKGGGILGSILSVAGMAAMFI